MRAGPLLLGLSLLVGACATERAAKLQRTADGTTLVGRVDGGFRIAAHGTDFTMRAPVGWRILLSTEEPLNATVVCASPDGKTFASVDVSDASPAAATATERAEANAYLRQLHRYKDPDIQMVREPHVTVPDGRELPVWRYFSDYWGQHLYLTIPAGSAIISIEAESRPVTSDTSALRDILRALVNSYRPKPR
jgi:hypothetical protein